MKNLTFEELLDKLEKALARIEALEKENKLLREEELDLIWIVLIVVFLLLLIDLLKKR